MRITRTGAPLSGDAEGLVKEQAAWFEGGVDGVAEFAFQEAANHDELIAVCCGRMSKYITHLELDVCPLFACHASEPCNRNRGDVPGIDLQPMLRKIECIGTEPTGEIQSTTTMREVPYIVLQHLRRLTD